MIQLYAKRTGIKSRIGNHSLCAMGITDYLKRAGSLTEARKMANHADTRITQLYDRREDTASHDEYGENSRNPGVMQLLLGLGTAGIRKTAPAQAGRL